MCGGARPVLRAWLVQLAILSNLQNGRDTHVRQVRLYAPATTTTADAEPAAADLTPFTSVPLQQEQVWR
jgi:hypothetical protein